MVTRVFAVMIRTRYVSSALHRAHHPILLWSTMRGASYAKIASLICTRHDEHQYIIFRSMDVGHVHAVTWIFLWGYTPTFPRRAPFYACVCYFRKCSTHCPPPVWPVNLVTCALFNTLHAASYAGIGTRAGISRGRFFLYAWIASICWHFLPGYLFQGLSYFSWVCWIAPNNVVVNQLFGYVHGLGMSLITFDWAQISYIGVYAGFRSARLTYGI